MKCLTLHPCFFIEHTLPIFPEHLLPSYLNNMLCILNLTHKKS